MTCLCTGSNRKFQNSTADAKFTYCTCKDGYQPVPGNDILCVPKIYPLCTDTQTRGEDGQCYDKKGWEAKCIAKCGGIDEFVGVNQEMGMCQCKVKDLEQICDSDCRNRNKRSIELVCKGGGNEIKLNQEGQTSKELSKETIAAQFLNGGSLISDSACDKDDGSTKSMFLAEITDQGFVGVYEPKIEDITGPITDKRRRRRRRDAEDVTGIKNPVTCIDLGTTIIFTVSKERGFPMYNRDSLYNTNKDFDETAFIDMKELIEASEIDRPFFAYTFNQPGTFSFEMSKDKNKTMTITVMDSSTQCSETGPWFEDRPLKNIMIGNKVHTKDLIVEPDWIVIGALIASCLIASVILITGLVLFKKYGWNKSDYVTASYRAKAKHFSLDEYASKGSVVRPARKVNPNNANSGTGEVTVNETHRPQVEHLPTVVEDEFWDYDKQVDLEGFTSTKLYEHLDHQGHTILTGLSKQKQEAKALYMKVADQNESLKGLWVSKMRLKGKSSIATAEDLQDYEDRKRELEEELVRRKRVGADVGKILIEAHTLHTEREKLYEEHQVKFNVNLKDVLRSLRVLAAPDKDENLDEQELVDMVEEGVVEMSQDHTTTCKAVGAWGVIYSATGAPIVYPDNPTIPIPVEELLNEEGLVKPTPGVIDTDPVTSLLVPAPGVQILGADNETVESAPPLSCVHPRTARVIPVHGNVMFDPNTSQLVIGSDNSETMCPTSPLIPFIVHPTRDGAAIPTKLSQVEKKGDLHYQAPIPDPQSGLFAPLLAVTIHPETRELLPVSGTHIHPVTNLRVPIEIGGMMTDHSLGQAVPILGISINPDTGEVEPVGGRAADGYEVVVTGEQFSDPLSGLLLSTCGLYLNSTEQDITVNRGNSNYLTLLTSTEMATELALIDTIDAAKELAVDRMDMSEILAKIESLMQDLHSCRMRSKTSRLQQEHDLQRELEHCIMLQESGGSPGNMEHRTTGQLLPLLIGAWMSDPGGTGLEVPILGTEREAESGLLVPIGGTMEDPNGAGPVPISLGTLALDTANNQVGPVCGARRDPDSKLVVPVTMGETPPPSNRGSPIQVSMLEEELLQRTMFWRRQRAREIEINNTLLQLKAIILDALPESLDEMSEFTADTDELLAAIERDAKNMANSHTKEVKRRGDMSSIYAQQLPPVAVAMTTENDEEEGKREVALHQVFTRIPEVIQRHMKKVGEELKKFLERCEKTPHSTDSAREKHEAMTERLQNDIKTQLLNRLVTIDEKSSALEYIRERAELCGIEAKLWLSGKGTASWTSTVQGMYGDLPASSSSHKDLIPLIEKLIELLKSSSGKEQFVRVLAGAVPQNSTLIQTMEHLVKRGPAVIQSGNVTSSHKPTSKIKLVLPDILEQEEEEEEEGRQSGLYNVPGGDLITKLHTSTGELLDLTYRAGKLYDTQDNIITNLYKHGDITYGEDGKLYNQAGEVITLLYRPDGTSYPINYQEKKKKKKIRKQPTRVKVSLSDTDPRKMAMRQLLEKHTLETVELEDMLNKKKIELVNKIIGEAEEKKRALKKDIQSQLRVALQNAADTDDKNAIMMRYADMLDQRTGEIEEDKKKALREMMEKLADEIVQKKTALREKQIAEIDAAGLTEEVEAALPHLRHNIVPNRSKIAEDIEKLAKQQEILAAEMKKYLAEDQARACLSMDDDIRKELDREMEERCKRMTSLGAKAKVVTDTIKTTRETQVQTRQRGVDRDKMQQNMRKRMQQKRQDRRKLSKVPSEVHLKPATEKEEYGTEDAVYQGEIPEDILLCEDYRQEVQYDADLKEGMTALLEVVEEHQREEDNYKLLEELNSQLNKTVAGESDKIIAAYKECLDNVSNKIQQDKTRSANSVAERLAARKRLREQRLTGVVKDDVINEVGLGKIGLSESEVQQEVDTLTEKIQTQSQEDLRDKKEEMIRKFEKRRSTLVTELSQETDKARIQEEKEETERQEALARSLDDKASSILAARNQQFEQELKEKEEQLQKDEKDRLLSEHKAEMSKLSQTLSTQKDNQMSSMKARLEERRKMKEQKLKEKQEAELQRVREEEEFEQFKLEEEEARKKEKAALNAVVHDMVDVGMDAKAQSLIHHLLSQRHLKARIVLEKEQKSHLKTVIQQARSEVLQERDEKRDEILARQEQEMTSLLEDALNLSPELVEKKQEEVRRKHNKELSLFDEETEELLEQREVEVTAEQRVEAAHQLLILKEQQLLEMSRTLRDMTGDEEAANKYAEQAEQLAGQAEEHRDRVTRETEEKMRLLKEEKLKREEEIKQKMQSELSSLEKELQEEEKRHQLREQEVDKQHDLLARRKLMEREKELQSEMRDADAAEKDAILAKYDQDVKKITTLMNNEKDKSRNKLKDQLEARRNKRKQAMLKKIEEKKSEELRELDDQVRSTKSSTLLESAESLRGVAGSAFLNAPTQSEEATEEEKNAAMMKLFENTDIFKELSSIEEMLGLKAQNALKISGKDKARPYIDLRDAQWSNSDALRPMDVSKLSPSNFVIYRFGLFLSRLLKTRCDFPKVTVLLADSLPHNNYVKNAYRHSYIYEEDKEILFVRKERTESVGEFCVVVAHALSHIKIGDMRDDNHPFFLRHFYRALRVICTDMFFGRASHSPLADISLEAPSSNTWEYALSLGRSKSEQYNVVSSLVDLRVTEPSQLDFSPHELTARLDIAKDSNLKDELSTLVNTDTAFSSNFLENRIEKLNNLPDGSVKPAHSKKISSYSEIMEVQRERLGLQIDELSTEILDNARKSNDMSQSLSIGENEARTTRLNNLGSARQYLADKIELLNKERSKKLPDRDEKES